MNDFTFGSSHNRILKLQVKLCFVLIWFPMCPFHLFGPHCLFCSSFFFSVGNELHEAGHTDDAECTNEGRDPKAALLSCSTPGVNGSNFSLINHTNSNWLLITCSVAWGSSLSFLTFLRSSNLSHRPSAVLLICSLRWHYVAALTANEKCMQSEWGCWSEYYILYRGSDRFPWGIRCLLNTWWEHLSEPLWSLFRCLPVSEGITKLLTIKLCVIGI